MRETEEIILPEDDRAAKEVTLTLWQSRDGQYWQTEESARRNGATHHRCDCGNLMRRYYTLCDDCRDQKAWERYREREKKPWDGEAMIYAEGEDHYFWDLDDLEYFCEDHGCAPSDLRLVICEPRYVPEASAFNHVEDLLPEDGEVPDEVLEAFDELNKRLRAIKRPICWMPGKYALDLEGQ